MASQSEATASSNSTLQRISTSELQPGMFLVRVLDSWWKSPFFVHRRLLNSPIEVQQLMSSGIREVEIDTSLSVKIFEAASDDGLIEETENLIMGCDRDGSNEDGILTASVGSESSSNPKFQTEESKKREELVLLRRGRCWCDRRGV